MRTETQADARRGFATGEFVVLRPALESDLPELTKLLAANPADLEPEPWTIQRITKEFNDADGDIPGLWGKEQRYFTIAISDGTVVGFLKEKRGDDGRSCWNRLYIGEHIPNRTDLCADAAKTYLAYKCKWHNPTRIAFDALELEVSLTQGLELAGFELEMAMDQLLLYQGKPATYCCYAWLSEEVLRLWLDDGPVAGEGE